MKLRHHQKSKGTYSNGKTDYTFADKNGNSKTRLHLTWHLPYRQERKTLQRKFTTEGQNTNNEINASLTPISHASKLTIQPSGNNCYFTITLINGHGHHQNEKAMATNLYRHQPSLTIGPLAGPTDRVRNSPPTIFSAVIPPSGSMEVAGIQPSHWQNVEWHYLHDGQQRPPYTANANPGSDHTPLWVGADKHGPSPPTIFSAATLHLPHSETAGIQHYSDKYPLPTWRSATATTHCRHRPKRLTHLQAGPARRASAFSATSVLAATPPSWPPSGNKWYSPSPW